MEQIEDVIRTRFVDPYKGTLAILRRRGAYHSAGQIYLYKAGKQMPQVAREVKCEIHNTQGPREGIQWRPQVARKWSAKYTTRKDYGKESSLTISLYTNTSSPEVSVGWWRSVRSFHPTAHQSELTSLQIPTVLPNQNPRFPT